MQTDLQRREIALKLVYYGPPLSGKTTNLLQLHERLDASVRGRLLTLDTAEDRTLFFDLLPVVVRSNGVTIKVKLFTVPGQVMHQQTRKLVLQNVDGVVFVADSQLVETRSNNVAWADLKSNLQDNGIDPRDFPVVIQFNKRDLPPHLIRTDEDIDRLALRGSEPIYRAVAFSGEGVVETFLGLVERTWLHLDAKLGLERRYGLARGVLLDAVVHQLQAPSPTVWPAS